MMEKSFCCEICFELALSSQKFQHKNTEECSHNFCIKCITMYIQEKIQQNLATIKCPGLGCDIKLDPLECQPLIPPKLFIRWCDSLSNLHISGFEKSYCPYSNCSELILNECGESETVKRCLCPNCKRYFCFKCRVPWHAGYWCSESHRKRDIKDIEFGRLVENMKWTRCPSCGQSIERLSGCPEVMCRCGRSFCHLCGCQSHGPHSRCQRRNADTIGTFICVFLFIIAVSWILVIGLFN